MNWVFFFIDGITSSFGVILAPIMTNFDSNRSTVSWIGSLILGVYHLSGPIVSLLVKRFGLRVVSISGAFLSSIALLLSTLRLCCVVVLLLHVDRSPAFLTSDDFIISNETIGTKLLIY